MPGSCLPGSSPHPDWTSRVRCESSALSNNAGNFERASPLESSWLCFSLCPLVFIHREPEKQQYLCRGRRRAAHPQQMEERTTPSLSRIFHVTYKWRHLELNVGSHPGAGRHRDRSLSQTFQYWVSTGTLPVQSPTHSPTIPTPAEPKDDSQITNVWWFCFAFP